MVWFRGISRLTAAALLASIAGSAAYAQETIKVGILHSLSGTMAISETTLKDVMLMLIEEQNKKGGLLGKQLEAVVVDPASDWPLFAEKARELITVNGVAGDLRLLDLGVAEIRAAGLRGAELAALLSRPVRGRGKLQERLLHRRRAEPAGDPRRRLPDERGRRRALGARRHRLRLSAHDQQDPRGLSRVEGRRRRRHHDQLHAVRPFRLADDRLRHQGLRLGRQEDRRRLHHQRRRQRALLQGARQPGRLGGGHPGRRLLGRRGGARRHRHRAARRPSRRLELLHVGRRRRNAAVHRRLARLHQETRSASPTTRWKPTTSASTCG